MTQAKDVREKILTKFELWGYRLCWRGDWISDLWSRIWFRYYCPYPIIADRTVRACRSQGHCGCNNNPRHVDPDFWHIPQGQSNERD